VHVDSFLTHLRTQGYAKRTLRKKRWITASFVRWAARRGLAVHELNESHLARFVRRSPRKQKARITFELSVLKPFLTYLRAEAGVPVPPLMASGAGDLKRRYTDYLRKERGLAENSIRVYVPLVGDFLDELVKTGCTSPVSLDARFVQDFLLGRIQNRPSGYGHLLTSALRSVFRFLYLRKEATLDLSLSIPTVRKGRHAEVTSVLSPDEVKRVLAAPDRSTPRGRRDHAILLLLARLGLRAGEVVSLKLGDLRWRTGEIVVRGKGRLYDRLPLLEDIGEALALYLTADRGENGTRQVFLRMRAPRVGFSGPAAVGSVVRRALADAGIEPPGRGAAHLFRHSLATRMIRHGASLAEISEILRHRSPNSTELYAKVDFASLREVARPWPGKGGAR
jgi:site-specific recombinase XerD